MESKEQIYQKKVEINLFIFEISMFNIAKSLRSSIKVKILYGTQKYSFHFIRVFGRRSRQGLFEARSYFCLKRM